MGGNGGRPALFVGFTGDHEVRKPAELAQAMTAWSRRIATTSATDVIERCVRSTWEASTR